MICVLPEVISTEPDPSRVSAELMILRKGTT